MKKILLSLLILTLLLTGCNKKEEKVKEKYDTEEFHFENLSKDGYGFIEYNDDLVQLNKNGESKVIIDLKNENIEGYANNSIILNSISNNKLYFVIKKGKNERFFYINLDKLEVKQISDTDWDLNSTFIMNGIMNDDYLFYIGGCKDDICKTLYRYNFKTSKEESYEINVPEAYYVYIYNSKLYCEHYISYESGFDYYTMNFDGSDMKYITKEEYYEIKNKNNIIINDVYADIYYVYNNKKVYVKDNTLYYGDEVIYKPKSELIDIYYMNEYGKIGIKDYRVYAYSDTDVKYYVIDLEIKKITEVSDDNNMENIIGYGNLLYSE